MSEPNTADEVILNYETVRVLDEILTRHTHERVCVLGTMCCGKTTLLRQNLHWNGLDMDAALWPLLSEAEAAYICQTPWTEAIGDEVDRLTRERLCIAPGQPLFGTVIVDCDVIIYLEIDDGLLHTRCTERDEDFSDALHMRDSIENDMRSYVLRNDTVLYRVWMGRSQNTAAVAP